MTEGIKQIRSGLISALYNKVADRIGDSYTLIGVAFYIVPLINAMNRVGSQEQKELMFKAFCGIYSEFDYTKRDKTEIKESIYERVAREAGNAKARQDRQKKSIIESVADYIEKKGLDDNKVILCNVDELLTSELTGLVCMGIAEKYKRPALLYRTRIREDEDNKDERIITLEGSARNYDGFELADLKAFLETVGVDAQGHPNACGVAFNPDDESKIIKQCNEKLKDYDIDYTFDVDFIIEFEDLEDYVFYEMDKLKHIYGQKVDEPQFAILNIDAPLSKINVIRGKTGTTIKIEIDDVTFIKFRVDEDDELLRFSEDWDIEAKEVTLNVVGNVGINSFAGVKSNQVMVRGWEIIN